jgi:hypothetical protein
VKGSRLPFRNGSDISEEAVVARYPGAVYRPLGRQTEPLVGSHDIVCMHTMVGYLTSTDALFREGGYTGTESHFGVGGKWGPDARAGLDGVVYQWQDTGRQADANSDGNHRIISIETADNAAADGDDIPDWTPKQVEAIAQITAWCCRLYRIPAALVPDSKPGRRGIAYHRQGVDPWRVAGGERWSVARGKECPGDNRIDQLKQTVIPRVRGILDDSGEGNMGDEHTANIQLMGYVKAIYEDPDGLMNRDQLLQHAAAQAKAANDTVGTALEQLSVLRRQMADLQAAMIAMQATLDRHVAG